MSERECEVGKLRLSQFLYFDWPFEKEAIKMFPKRCHSCQRVIKFSCYIGKAVFTVMDLKDFKSN